METDEQTRKTLRYSFADGIFASGMIGFTQEYFTPFLLFLGGTLREVALLSSIPNIVASLIQLKTYDFIRLIGSRKGTITLFVLLQALTVFAMAFMPLSGIAGPSTFIAAAVLFTTFGAISTPAWGSLMANLVPEKKRGNYFGWRNSIMGSIIVGTSLCAGLLLYTMKQESIAWGFTAMFGSAFMFRLLSWFFLNKMHDPDTGTPVLRVKISLKSFIKKLKGNNFARFVLAVSLLNFSVNLCSPYFAVLLLNELHFNYILYSGIMMSAPLSMYLFMRRWGNLADSIGNVRILKLTGPGIALIPLLWVVSRNPVYLVITQVFSGFLWAGYNLSASNFIFDAVEKEKRVRYISYFNVLNGLLLSTGAIIGGLIVNLLPPLQGYKILSLFVISSLLRLACAITIPLKLREVRRVENISSNHMFFSLIGIRPLIGIQRKTIRYLR